MKSNIHNLMAGSLMLTVALAAGCARESKGPRVHNHPPATVGPPTDLSQFDPPPPAEAAPEAIPQIVTSPPTTAAALLHPEVADVVEMAKRGVGDEALLAFVEQNPLTHRIAPETIIYLNDIGVAESVVALMIRQGDAEPVEENAEAAPEPAKTAGQPVASTPPPAPAPPADAPPVANNYYHGALDPYGDWIYDSSHGWVWRPTVAMVDTGWRPYRQGGRWIYSDVGWYWHSYYSWGWAPFHYGRWHRSGLHGWCWVPGYTWSPAWVMWRYNDLHCGWAPLPPGCDYVFGVGYMWHGSRVSLGFHFGLGHSHFTYCDYAYLRHRRLHRHHVPDTDIAVIHNETTIVNNYVTENNNTIINNGIPPEMVADKTREPVQKMRVRELDLEMESIARVGQIDANGKTMAIYRPNVPTPPGTPGEKPSGRTPVTKNPPSDDTTEDKLEADRNLLKESRKGNVLADRGKITGRLSPGTVARPLGRSYSGARSSRPVAASPGRTSPAKPGRSASTASKPSASRSQTLGSTLGAPAKSRATPTKPSASKSYSRTSPRVSTTRKPGRSANSRLLAPSSRSSARPSRSWQQRPSTSYSAPRATPKSSARPSARTSRLPSARPAPRYKPPASRYSPPSSTRTAPSRSYRSPAASRPAPSRSYSPPARSAPSRSYSAPSRSYSAPSRSYSPPPSSPPPSSSGSSGSSDGGSRSPR